MALRLVTLALAAATVAGTSACGGSALVRDDDATFARASARLVRATEEVDASGAPAAERALFLQAEAFYRYRFASEARGGAAMTAEAAAAITDFPALQSLAGSLDLADLRLRSADAAVQLWETFLRRYPRSVLRPLTLYRLGWAYRSVSISGLPRDSGDAAFDELSSVSGIEPSWIPIVQDARRVHWKSKDAAARWSLVPGLGQIYAGQRAGGALSLGIALAAAAAIVIPLVIGAERSSDLTWKHDWPLLATGIGGVVVLSIDYTTSYEAATRGVVHWNEQKEATFEDSHPEAP